MSGETALARTPSLFVDTTRMALLSGVTGIPRVITQLGTALATMEAPGSLQVKFSEFGPDGFLYQRGLPTLGGSHAKRRWVERKRIDLRPSDVVLFPDVISVPHGPRDSEVTMLREQGVRVFFIGYDLLPKTHPQYFRPYSRLIYDRWFEAAVRADGILFISSSAEREFTRFVADARGAQSFSPRTGHTGLACEVPVFAQRAATGRKSLQNRKSFAFLMVGTLEPRKGHQAVLDAFERLWEKGRRHTLTIVGRPGWLTEKLQKRIRQHPQLGLRLFFLDKADDEQLWREYITADALIANSEAEGYGLPLIEAAAVGLPILARKIEPFVEIAGDHAFYLDSGDADSVVDSIIEWCSLASAGTNPDSRAIEVNNWTTVAEEVLEFLGRHDSAAR